MKKISRRDLLVTGATASMLPIAGLARADGIPGQPPPAPPPGQQLAYLPSTPVAIFTEQTIVNQMTALDAVLANKTVINADDVQLYWSVTASLRAQISANLMNTNPNGAIHGDFSLLQMASILDTDYSVTANLSQVGPRVEPSDFLFGSDYAYDFGGKSYAQLIEEEAEMMAAMPVEMPDWLKMVLSKIGLIFFGLTVDDALEIYDLFQQLIGVDLQLIWDIIQGVVPYAGLTFIQKMKKIKALVERIIGKLLSKAFLNMLIERMGREKAEKLIKKLASKAVPFLGWALLIWDTATAFYDQLFGEASAAPAFA